MSGGTSGPDGLLLVDKPAGWTSHDVVARVRRLLGTKKVGHAGTLDPMATGLLLLGIGRATRLLGHLSLREKTYEAVLRLGAETSTDDREGEIVARADTTHVGDEEIRRAAASLTGTLSQVPPAVSAIKVDGRRAYARVRAGEVVEMKPREVTVTAFDIGGIRRVDDVVDIDARVRCSSGTYIRSLARDLGRLVGSAGHLAELRRTTLGPYDIADAQDLSQWAEASPPVNLPLFSLADAASAAFPTLMVTDDQATALGHGIGLEMDLAPGGPTAALRQDGALVALLEARDGRARPLAVFLPGKLAVNQFGMKKAESSVP